MERTAHPRDQTPSPAELRSMFGANLRQLAQSAQSISALCRDLGINRTQFNRYLAGESFPRPDVLHRICSFFDVDARILLSPVSEIEDVTTEHFQHAEIKEFLGTGQRQVPETTLPSGLYRFSRSSFVQDDQFVVGVTQIYRKADQVFMRGYEAKDAMRSQGIEPTAKNREFRGVVLQQENGISILVSRRNTLTFSFSFLTPQASFERNMWVGYTTRTTAESITGRRASRIVFEHLNKGFAEKMQASRASGIREAAEILPFHAQQLRVGHPFS